jgi:hypothetical protein
MPTLIYDLVHELNTVQLLFLFHFQSLCDQQMFDKSDEFFLKALDIEPDNANIYVHRG